MWNTKFLATAGIAVVAIASCATSRSVEFTLASDPGGAKVYEGDVYRGFAPLRLSRAAGADGCLRIEHVTMAWASGARTEPVSLQICSGATAPNFVFARPPSIPGSALDLEFQKQYIHNEIFVQTPQARSMTPAQLAELYDTLRERNRYLLRAKLVSCTSMVSGNQVRTTCE